VRSLEFCLLSCCFMEFLFLVDLPIVGSVCAVYYTQQKAGTLVVVYQYTISNISMVY
jgi:hypothetical protein